MSRLREVDNILAGADSEERLNIIHFLRIKYREELKKHSAQSFDNYRKKVEEYQRNIKEQHGKDPPGVYYVLIVDPERNVIFYPGKTSGKSKTSGLGFRLRDHGRFLAKTPLTLFVPNWWIKRVYPIPVEEPEKAKELEDALWSFIESHSDQEFSSVEELENEITEIVRKHVDKANIVSIEIEEMLEPNSPFLLKVPPAGRPRGMSKNVSKLVM